MSGYRRYKSRYGYRRRKYYGYNRRYMSTARKANIAYKSTRKMVKREEIKNYIREDLSSTISTGFMNLAAIARGTGDRERIGNTITPTSLRIKLLLRGEDALYAPIAGNWTQLFRILVVVWKGQGSPTLGDILENTNAGSLLTTQKSIDDKYNSKILYDKVHRLDSQMQSKYVKITIKKGLRRYPITYNDGSGSTAFKTNGLGMFILSPAQQSVTGNFYYTLNSKLCYKDM